MAFLSEVANQIFETGETVVVEVEAGSFEDMIGFQYTLKTDGLTTVDISSGAIDMSKDNIALHKDRMTASWYRSEGVNVDEGKSYSL